MSSAWSPARATTSHGEIDARRRGTANAANVWNVATRITRASLTHRQAPYARLPEEWSLPKGVPVVGAGTARHVSHPWSCRTCSRTRMARHEGSRCRVETELPTCREATYIRRARGRSPLCTLPRLILLLLFLPLLLYRIAPRRERDRTGGVAPTSAPFIPTTQRPTPFIPLRRAVTRLRGGWDPLVTGHHSPLAPTLP